MVHGAELLLNARRNQQQRHVEAAKVQLRDLLMVTETVVAHDHEQGVLVVRRFTRLLEELTQRPVGIAHGSQVLVQTALPRDLLDRQVFRQGVGRVVGQGLQQGVDRLLAVVLGQLLLPTVEHVLVGDAPGRVGEHRVDEVVAADEGGHALVAEEPGLVVPGEIAVVDIHVVVVARTQQRWQARQFVPAFRRLHQVLETGQVREARHGGEHALVGVGAIGEEAVEQQPFFGQLVEIRGDVGGAAQRAHRVTGKALHQNHHHVLHGQGAVGWRVEIAAYGGFVGIDQGVEAGQQHVAHGLTCVIGLQYGLPQVGAVFAEAALGSVDQGQGAVQTQLVNEVGVRGVSVAPTHGRALAQGATGSDHRHQQDHHEHGHMLERAGHRPTGIRRAGLTDTTGQAIDALEQQAQQPGTEQPGQQVTHHREAVPEHAQHGLGVFVDVLEHQAIEALVEFTVEVQLHQAQQQHDAGPQGQPQAEETTAGHCPRAEKRQQQRHAEVGHDAQVEAQTIDQAFGHGGHGRVVDHVAVVDQQGHADQAQHEHDQQRAQAGVGEVRGQSRCERCRRSTSLQGVRVCHEWRDPRT